MSLIKTGDVVLVSFPFTDLSGSKLRPAVVISRERVHQKEDGYTLLFISSVVPAKLEAYEVLFQKNHPNFQSSGLKKDSVFKANKIVTIQRKLLKRHLGHLGPQITEKVQSALREALFLDKGEHSSEKII